MLRFGNTRTRRRRGNYNTISDHAWYVPGVADMFILLLWLFVGLVLGLVVSALFIRLMGQASSLEYTMLISYPLQFLPAMLYVGYKSRKNSFDSKGFALDSNNFAPVGGWLAALFVILATLAAAYATDAINYVMPPIPEWLEKAFRDMTSGNFWVNFLCVSIMAPFFEEWLCRGMILRGLLYESKIKPFWAIVISSVFFAIIHMNPWQAIPAFILGCLFGYVYYKTGSLKLTMLMHFANNTMALVAARIPALEDADNWVSILGKGRYWAYFVLALVVLGLVILAFERIKPKSPQGNCDEVEPLVGYYSNK